MTVDFTKIKKHIGANIKKYRKLAGLTQTQLGIQSNISRERVAQLERGLGAPGMVTLFTIASALKVPASKLVEIE